MNADEIKRLRELDKWLGSKKWYRGESTDEDGNVFADDMILCESYCVGEPTEICCVHVDGEYADLICEMRNALPGLLDRVEALEAENARLRGKGDRLAAIQRIWNEMLQTDLKGMGNPVAKVESMRTLNDLINERGQVREWEAERG